MEENKLNKNSKEYWEVECKNRGIEFLDTDTMATLKDKVLDFDTALSKEEKVKLTLLAGTRFEGKRLEKDTVVEVLKDKKHLYIHACVPSEEEKEN